MRIPEPVIRAWTGLPFPYQTAIVVAIVFVVLTAAGGASVAVSKWKDRRFDAAEAKRAEERADEVKIRDAALRRAEAAEAQAAVVTEQNKALTQLATERGKTSAEKQAAADAIAREGQVAVAAVGDLPPDEAARDMHDRLVRLGLLKETP